MKKNVIIYIASFAAIALASVFCIAGCIVPSWQNWTAAAILIVLFIIGYTLTGKKIRTPYSFNAVEAFICYKKYVRTFGGDAFNEKRLDKTAKKLGFDTKYSSDELKKMFYCGKNIDKQGEIK